MNQVQLRNSDSETGQVLKSVLETEVETALARSLIIGFVVICMGSWIPLIGFGN